MIRFGELIQKFSEFRLESDIKDAINNAVKYVWEIPQIALDAWKTEIDEYEDKFTSEELENYRNMFEVKKSICGVHIISLSTDTKARLYQATENEYTFTSPNFLVSTDFNILAQSPYSNLVTLLNGKTEELPYVLKPKSFEFKTVFDGIDSKSNDAFGVFQGYDFSVTHLRDHNRQGEESIFGSVNYSSGDIHLVRSNTSNEEKFVKYYQMLAAGMNNGSGNNGQGGGTAVQIEPYDYATVIGTCIVLSGPLQLIFEMETNQDPYIEPAYELDE